MNTKTNTKKLVTLGMLCAVAYVMLLLAKLVPIQVAGFLNFDLKDTVIVIAGFLYGPGAAAMVTIVVSLVEMVTISSTGLWGLLMNVISSCCFAMVASSIYRIGGRKTLRHAVAGLIVAVLATTVCMLLWNWIVTPFYMGVPRGAVKAMLLPVFLPFNLAKYTINAIVARVIYKPISNVVSHHGAK